jgi:hypothetical protein
MLEFVLKRYDLKSLVVLLIMIGLCSLVGITWWELLLQNLNVVDWVLVGIWIFMFALLCWDVRFEKDVPLFLSAALGGLVIEWWGTNTELWWYFTRERPPVWILVAWPSAALATDRIAFLFSRFMSRERRMWFMLYWTILPLFVLGMTRFLWPTIHLLPSQLVVILMIIIVAMGKNHRSDVVLFVAGSFLGIFLEYWGTSRHCWNYYTGGIPPVIAVVAHGFASVAFARALRVFQWAANRLHLAWSVGPRANADADSKG